MQTPSVQNYLVVVQLLVGEDNASNEINVAPFTFVTQTLVTTENIVSVLSSQSVMASDYQGTISYGTLGNHFGFEAINTCFISIVNLNNNEVTEIDI